MAFSVSYTYQIIDRFSKPIRKMTQKSKEFIKTQKKSAVSARKLQGSLLNLGTGVGALASMAAMKAVVSTFTEFEEQLNMMQSMTKATTAEFDMMASKAKQLGITTKFSATEAAAGINMLGKNGLNATQILGGAIDAALLLSSATGADLASSADIATDAMANFNFKASEMNDVVNRIAGTTLNSKFDIDDYRLALGQAGGIAGKVGVSFDDFNTSIAAISPLFASGSDAGTAFKTFLQRMNPQSKEAKKIMKGLNIEFFNSAGKMKDMSDISQMLKKSFSGLTEQQVSHVASTLFGTDAMRAAIGMAGVGSDAFSKLSKEIGKTSSQQLALERMRGLSGAIKSMKSAWEGFQIAVMGSGVGSVLEMLVNTITFVLRGLSNLPKPVLIMIGAIAGLVAVMAPLAAFAGMMVALWPALVAGAAALIPVLIAMTGPIGLIVLAVTALVAGFTFLAANWDKVKAFFGFGGDQTAAVKSLPNMDVAEFATVKTSPGFTSDQSVSAQTTSGEINGAITVTAEPGTRVTKTESRSTMPGNLGMNMAMGS